MKKKRLLILLLQICLIIGFALSFYFYVQKEIRPTPVYKFNKNLIANTQITKADFDTVTIPLDAVNKTKGLASSKTVLVGKYVKTDVYKDNYVYDEQITEGGKIDPFKSMDVSKLRKVSLPISFVDGLAGNLKRGDKVDLVFTAEGKKKSAGAETTFNYSKVFMQDVYIFNVASEEGYIFQDRSTIVKGSAPGATEGEKIDSSSNSDKIAVITLAVSLDQAEEIETRMKSGQVKLLGRFDDSKSYDTLGYVLGDFVKIFTGTANAETGK